MSASSTPPPASPTRVSSSPSSPSSVPSGAASSSAASASSGGGARAAGTNAAQTRRAGSIKGAEIKASNASPNGTSSAPASSAKVLRDIPVAIPTLTLDGERFTNFDILNNLFSQLEYEKKWGSIYAVGLPGSKSRLIVISDPDLLQTAAYDTAQIGKKVEGINFFKQLASGRGGGISVRSDGPSYDSIRRVMLPWYAPAHQKTQFPRMLSVASDMLSMWSTIPLDETMDMRDHFIRYALEISGRGACSFNFHTLDNKSPQKTPFAKAVVDVMRESVARVAEPAPDSCPFWQGNTEKKQKSELFHTQGALIKQHIESMINQRQTSAFTTQQTDLISRLLTETDPDTGAELDKTDVRDQVMMHLSNGFNGPSIVLGWLMAYMAKDPEVEARVIGEIDDIAGCDPDYVLQYTDLFKMPYITAFIKETMRIHPPMPVTIRNSLRDGDLDGWKLRKGDIILVAALCVHRKKEHWGDHPDKFDPSHFTIDKIMNRHRHAYVPFSIGIRQCMAQEVSFMMLRVALFSVFHKYRLRLIPGFEVKPRPIVTLTPVSIQVTRVPREDKQGRLALRKERLEREAAAAAELKRRQAHDRAKSMADGGLDASLIDPNYDCVRTIPAGTSDYPKLTVAYGSNFGVSKGIANRFIDTSVKYGFQSEIKTLNALMEDFAEGKEAHPNLLLICTPTYTGNPPGNAAAFKQFLTNAQPGPIWKALKYAVFGVGNSQWNAFMAFPKFCAQRLQELGATPLCPMGVADVNTPAWEQAGYEPWLLQFWPRVIKLAGSIPDPSRSMSDEASAASSALLSRTVAGKWTDLIAAARMLKESPPVFKSNSLDIRTQECTVVASDFEQATVEVRVEPAAFGLGDAAQTLAALQSGDDIEVNVFPANPARVVDEFSELLTPAAFLESAFSIPTTLSTPAVPRGCTLTVRNVLTNLVDLCCPPSLAFLRACITCAPDDELARGELALLIDRLLNGDTIEPTCTEVLQAYPAIKINLLQFLQVAAPKKSIAATVTHAGRDEKAQNGASSSSASSPHSSALRVTLSLPSSDSNDFASWLVSKDPADDAKRSMHISVEHKGTATPAAPAVAPAAAAAMTNGH